MDEKEMRVLIDNYKSNVAEYERLLDKINNNSYVTKVTAAYGLNSGGGGNGFSSKVENKVVDQNELIVKYNEFKHKVNIVDATQKILTKNEQEIIEFMKLGFTKLSTIAQLMHKKKKYIFDTRKRAIKKMCEYIGDKYEI